MSPALVPEKKAFIPVLTRKSLESFEKEKLYPPSE